MKTEIKTITINGEEYIRKNDVGTNEGRHFEYCYWECRRRL